jgi:hypothetical protein
MLNKLPARLMVLLLIVCLFAGSVFGSRLLMRHEVNQEEAPQESSEGGPEQPSARERLRAAIEGEKPAEAEKPPLIMARYQEGHILRFGLMLPSAARVLWLEYPVHSPIKYNFPQLGQITFPDGRSFDCAIDE